MASKSRDGWNAMHPEQPRVCRCGAKLRLTRDTIWFRAYPVLESFCAGCTPKWRLVRAPFRYEESA